MGLLGKKETVRWLIPELQSIYRVEADAIVKELNVEQLGRDDGHRLQPPDSATDLGESETRIQNQFIGGPGNLSKYSQDKVKICETGLQELALEHFKPETTSTDRLESELQTVVDSDRPKLQTLYEEEYSKAMELRHFRASNGLVHRDAHYPESLVFPLGLLIWVVIIESGMNMYFFSKGNDLGLLGGWFQALIVSAVNALIATVIGGLICMRYGAHKEMMQRVVAWVVLLAVIIPVLLLFNLAVAHYRDALSIDPENAYRIAIERLHAAPFDVKTFDGILLFLAGCVASVIFLIDGYRGFDDVYPKFRPPDIGVNISA